MKARSKWLRNVGAGNSSDTSTVTEERSEDVGYGGLHARQMPAFLETRITPTLGSGESLSPEQSSWHPGL